MSVVMVFAIIVIAAFVGAFVTARRFGVMALGLAAGSILSSLWVSWLTSFLNNYNLGLTWLPMGVLAAILLLLAPLILLLLNGPKYNSKYERIFSSLAIGLLTAAFLVEPFGKFMTLDGNALAAYQWLSDYWQYVVTVGLVVGVVDVFLIHGKKPAVKPKKH